MRALIVSDLHFEFHRDGGRTLVSELAPAEILVCAGDLCTASELASSLDLLCERYPDVVYVCGNHEFYRSSFDEVRAILRETLSRHGGHLHVLDNTSCEVDGVRFVGTTMWTRFFPENLPFHRRMHDFSVIRGANPGIYEENAAALAFLEREVARGDVVVTHHLPDPRSVHPRYAGDPLNRFFVCDVGALLAEREPRLWVHGHTHASRDYRVGECRVVCNPFGYAGREVNPDFRPDLLVDL